MVPVRGKKRRYGARLRRPRKVFASCSWKTDLRITPERANRITTGSTNLLLTLYHPLPGKESTAFPHCRAT